VMTAKEQVLIYGESFVKKSLALPLTLQERMEKGYSIAREKVTEGSEFVKAKMDLEKMKLLKKKIAEDLATKGDAYKTLAKAKYDACVEKAKGAKVWLAGVEFPTKAKIVGYQKKLTSSLYDLQEKYPIYLQQAQAKVLNVLDEFKAKVKAKTA